MAVTMRVDNITDGIYRISAQDPDFPITMNQFLIEGEHPALIHTGTFPAYEEVRRAVAQVMDPKMAPQWIHPMHGGSLPEEVISHYIQALRDEPFAFEGKI